VVIVGPDHPWPGRARVSVDELAAQTIFGGQPTSGTGTPLQNVLGQAAARMPATVNLGSTAAGKEAVHAGLGISLVLASAADTDRRAGRLHTLAIDGPPLRKALWHAHRGTLVPEDPAALFTRALATAVA
jgi:DNA-binding transcriptional LysR family regulator